MCRARKNRAPLLLGPAFAPIAVTMSAPKTRLDSFLRVVELDEDAAAIAHAQSLRELQEQRDRVAALRAQLERDARKRARQEEWMVIELERQRLADQLKQAEQKRLALEKAEQTKRAELSAAHQKAESIRHAIDRLRGEALREATRRELRESDELALQRHRRVANG